MKVRSIVIGCLAAAVAAPAFADIRAVTPNAPDSDWAKKWWPGKFSDKAKELKEKGGSEVIFLGDFSAEAPEWSSLQAPSVRVCPTR